MASDSDSSFMGRTSVNIAMNVARTVAMALIGLMLVPYYLNKLGDATYGIIPLATTMTSYVMIVCDSLTAATTRYSVLAIRDGDPQKARTVFNTAFFGIGRICALIIPIIVILSIASPYIFSVPEGSETEVQMLFLGVLMASLIVTVASAFECVFQAFNKLYLIYGIKIIYVVLQVVIIVVMFNMSVPSLADVGLSYIVSALVLFVLFLLYAKKEYPELKICIRDYDRVQFRGMGTLGFWSIVERVGGLLYIQISLVLTNIYLGSETEAGFAIVSSMISMMHTACYSLTSTFTPLIYKCYADHDIERLVQICKSGLRIVSLLFAFPVAFIMVFSPEVLSTWVGPERAHLADLLRIAFISDILYCAVSAIGSVPIVYLRVKPVAIITLILGIANTVGALCVLLFTDFGVEGVMWVWVVSTILLGIYTGYFVAKIVKRPCYSILMPIVYGYAVCAVITGLMWGLSKIIEVQSTWLYMIPFALILFAVFSVPMYFLLLSRTDRRMIVNALPGPVASKLTKKFPR